MNFKNHIIKDARKRKMSVLGVTAREIAISFQGWLEDCLNDDGEKLYSRLRRGLRDKVLYEGMEMGVAMVLNSSVSSLISNARGAAKKLTSMRSESERLGRVLTHENLKHFVPDLLPVMR